MVPLDRPFDDQLRICRQWCQREKYAIVAEYCDYAISGRTDDRPEFQRMVANAGESDIVLVYMMDRFSRGEYDAPIYKRELAQHGVKLVSALEQIPDSPEGIIYEKLLEGLAACESKKTAIRTRRGMEGNALKCKTNGVRVYGYGRNDDDEYVVNEDEAAIVREAFRRSCDHEPVDSIASDFARRHHEDGQAVRLLDGVPDAPQQEVHGPLLVGRHRGGRRHAPDYRQGDLRDGPGGEAEEAPGLGGLGHVRAVRQGDLLGVRPQHGRDVGPWQEERQVFSGRLKILKKGRPREEPPLCFGYPTTKTWPG